MANESFREVLQRFLPDESESAQPTPDSGTAPFETRTPFSNPFDIGFKRRSIQSVRLASTYGLHAPSSATQPPASKPKPTPTRRPKPEEPLFSLDRLTVQEREHLNWMKGLGSQELAGGLSLRALRSAYRAQVKRLHPDRAESQQSPHSLTQFHRLQTAYEALREAHDRLMAADHPESKQAA